MSRRKCPKHGRRHSHSRYEPVFILDPTYLNRNPFGHGQLQLVNPGNNPSSLLMRSPQNVWSNNDNFVKPISLNVLPTHAVAPIQLQNMGIVPNEIVQRTAVAGSVLGQEGSPLQVPVFEGRVPLVLLNSNQQQQQMKIHKSTDVNSIENISAPSNHQMVNRRKRKKQQAKREYSKVGVNKEESSSSVEEEEFVVSNESDFPFEKKSHDVYMMKRIKNKSKPNKHVFAKNVSSAFSHGNNETMVTMTSELINQNLVTQKRIDGLTNQINELKACICPSEGDLAAAPKSARTTQTEVRKMLKLNGIQNIALIPADQWKPCNCLGGGGSGSHRSTFSGLRRSKSSATDVAVEGSSLVEESQRGISGSNSRVGTVASEEDSDECTHSILCPWNHTCKCCDDPSAENSYHITNTYFAATENNIGPFFPNCSKYSEEKINSSKPKCVSFHCCCEGKLTKSLLEVFWSIFITTLQRSINDSVTLDQFVKHSNEGDCRFCCPKRTITIDNKQSKFLEAMNILYEKRGPCTLNRNFNLDKFIFVKNVLGTNTFKKNHLSSIEDNMTSLNNHYNICPFLEQKPCALPNDVSKMYSNYETAINLCDKFLADRKQSRYDNQRRKRKKVLSETKTDSPLDRNRKNPQNYCPYKKEKRNEIVDNFEKMPLPNVPMDVPINNNKTIHQRFLDVRTSNVHSSRTSKYAKERRPHRFLKKSEDVAPRVSGEYQAYHAQYESIHPLMKNYSRDSASWSYKHSLLRECLCPPQKDNVGMTCQCPTRVKQGGVRRCRRKQDEYSQTVSEEAVPYKKFGEMDPRCDNQILLQQQEKGVMKKWVCKPLLEDVYSSNPETGSGHVGNNCSAETVSSSERPSCASKSCQANRNIGQLVPRKDKYDLIIDKLFERRGSVGECSGLGSSNWLCEKCKLVKTPCSQPYGDVPQQSKGVQCQGSNSTYLWKCDNCNKWNLTGEDNSYEHHTWQCKKCKVTIVQPINDVKIQEETKGQEWICCCCRSPTEETVCKRYREIKEESCEKVSYVSSEKSANTNKHKICQDCEECREGWRCKACSDVPVNKPKTKQVKTREQLSLCRDCRSCDSEWLCKTCNEVNERKLNKMENKEDEYSRSNSKLMLCHNCRRTNGEWICETCDSPVEKNTERRKYIKHEGSEERDHKRDADTNTYQILSSSSSHLIPRHSSIKPQRNVLFVKKSSRSLFGNGRRRYFGPNNSIFVSDIEPDPDFERTSSPWHRSSIHGASVLSNVETSPHNEAQGTPKRSEGRKKKLKGSKYVKAYRTSIKSAYGSNRTRVHSERPDPSYYHCMYEVRNEQRFGVTRTNSNSTESDNDAYLRRPSKINRANQERHSPKNKLNTGPILPRSKNIWLERDRNMNSGSLKEHSDSPFIGNIRFDKKSDLGETIALPVPRISSDPSRTGKSKKRKWLMFRMKRHPKVSGIFSGGRADRKTCDFSATKRSQKRLSRVGREPEDSGNRRLDNVSEQSRKNHGKIRTDTLVLRQLLEQSCKETEQNGRATDGQDYYIKKVELSKHKRSIYVIVKKKNS